MRKLSSNLAALLLLVAGFSLLAVSLRTQVREEPNVQRQREEWFYRQRAYPYRYVPSLAHRRGMEQLDQMLAVEEVSRVLSPTAPASNPTWVFIGPQPIQTPYSTPIVSGRVTALAIDPRDVNTMYLGGAQGGVWKTTNGGSAWTP